MYVISIVYTVIVIISMLNVMTNDIMFLRVFIGIKVLNKMFYM